MDFKDFQQRVRNVTRYWYIILSTFFKCMIEVKIDHFFKNINN